MRLTASPLRLAWAMKRSVSPQLNRWPFRGWTETHDSARRTVVAPACRIFWKSCSFGDATFGVKPSIPRGSGVVTARRRGEARDADRGGDCRDRPRGEAAGTAGQPGSVKS